MDLYRQAEFPDNTHFLIVDKLFHSCISKECKCKLMAKGKDVSVEDCLDIMRRYKAVEVTMKKLEEPGDTHIDASYTSDPTQKSQRNGSKRNQSTSESKTGNKRSVRKKSCIWCDGDVRSRNKCPAKDATCKFCGKQGHFEQACMTKKEQSKDQPSKHQHAVEITSGHDNSEYEDNFDLSAVSIHAVHNSEAREVFAPVIFHLKGDGCSTHEITGKVDTGAMVSCMPTSMLPQIGLSKKDLTPSNAIIRGMSGADLQNCGTVNVNVTCNAITAKARIYVTKPSVLSFLALDSPKISISCLLHLYAHNKVYPWSPTMWMPYTSLMNQKRTMSNSE